MRHRSPSKGKVPGLGVRRSTLLPAVSSQPLSWSCRAASTAFGQDGWETGAHRHPGLTHGADQQWVKGLPAGMGPPRNQQDSCYYRKSKAPRGGWRGGYNNKEKPKVPGLRKDGEDAGASPSWMKWLERKEPLKTRRHAHWPEIGQVTT